jgi:hypothetical protein
MNNSHSKKYQLSNNMEICPCPAELVNNGICQERNIKSHYTKYHHFALYKENGIVLNINNNLVMCKYHEKSKSTCSQKNKKAHLQVFTHQ